jgi:nitroreductase
VGSCIATLHREDAAREVLKLPENTGLFLALSFGYPAEDWTPNKGGRKSLDDVVRQETWS